MKILRVIILFLFWLQAFAAPVILCGLLSLWIYSAGEQNKTIALAILIAGVIGGIITAEFIRRRYGLSTFFAHIYGPNAMDTNRKDELPDEPV